MSELRVWLHGAHIATLTEERGRMRLMHTVGVGPLGSPRVSVAMQSVVERVGAALGPTRYELRIAVPDELVAYVDARVASLR